MLILDADQIPAPEILDRTLGYFRDPEVALVQTPQWFYNVPAGDPLGSQAPLFYGPIQQGKDGWNAAFFCGSNAVLRREALMQLGIAGTCASSEQRVRRALAPPTGCCARPPRRTAAGERRARSAGARRAASAVQARRAWQLRGGAADPGGHLGVPGRGAEPSRACWWRTTWPRIRADLADIPGLDLADVRGSMADVLADDADAGRAGRPRLTSPLAAIESVRQLLLAVDVDRDDEAQPVMPLATISVTEDMATAMRLHALGWRSVYHHEILARRPGARGPPHHRSSSGCAGRRARSR